MMDWHHMMGGAVKGCSDDASGHVRAMVAGTISLQEGQAAHERIVKAMNANKDGKLTEEEIAAFFLGTARSVSAALAETAQRGPRTRRTICSTFAIGVSGRMPWPRLKMSRPLA